MPDPETRPQAQVRKGRWGISVIWLVPAVAALIGCWMTVKAFTDRGPTVILKFQSGEGLEPGQTRIRAHAVEIGKVGDIKLSPDGAGVLVTADLYHDAYALLAAHSRFWVVRARISSSGITGMGTLISGAYIGFDPGPPDPPDTRPPRAFTGLETPPILTLNRPGRLVKLQAARLGSLNIGSPVHFRQIQVGEVVGSDLREDGRSVTITAFINAPYDALVNLETRFWDAGGVQLSVEANGLRLRSDSILDLMIGGISFENGIGLAPAGPVPAGHVFNLYPDHDRIHDHMDLETRQFVLIFKDSVRGLSRGAPVEYRGIKVGQVEDLTLAFPASHPEGLIPVLISLEPERFKVEGGAPEEVDRIVGQLVQRGLRAQLKMGSLLTGSLFIDLTFHPESPRRSLGQHGAFAEIPTLPSSMGALAEKLTRFADRLEKLPIEDLVAQVRANLPVLKATLQQAQALMAHVDRSTLPEVEATLNQARATLAGLNRVLSSDSPAQADLLQALEQFSQAARAVKDLADTLERHPESLLRGKGDQP